MNITKRRKFMSKTDFSQIEKMLKTSDNFSLTGDQYRQMIGRDMPKDNYYLTHKSALADFAKRMGFDVKVRGEKIITFEKRK